MPAMLASVGKTVLDVFLVTVATAPVIGFVFFARWFLRAGKRYDERERAAKSSRPSRPPCSSSRYAAGAMFWLTRNTFSGSYCALIRASRS
jgi:hypothetical protein